MFLILLFVALGVFVLELSSKQHMPRREKTCLLGFRQRESRLNRLDRKLIFFSHEASLGMILLKKQTTKLLMILRGCAGWSGPLLLQITEDRFSQTTKLLMILRGCAGWSGPLLLQITEDRFSQSRSNCYMCHLTMTHIRKQDAKFDYREI